VAWLATTDPDGRPHLVPIVFALEGDTLYSAVDRKPKRSSKLRRIENARARPDVTILVDHYEDDWQYRSEPPNGPVLAVDVTEVREWSGG
jgi:PPOX class probable F420-dependent enzyme